GRMLRQEPVTIYGDGLQERDFLYVGDCARANLLAVQQAQDGIYNLGTGRGANINELFDILREITHYPLRPGYGPAKVGETYKIYLQAAKAARDLGWQPTLSLSEGLSQTVAYFQTHELTTS
ncbi:MAG: GDP-mannose 4,6-dehydratase, partial [Anaerolineales bacterium]|nr:GDP-mannose 4,6-dehydratase [Anaerolineales bacterium]